MIECSDYASLVVLGRIVTVNGEKIRQGKIMALHHEDLVGVSNPGRSGKEYFIFEYPNSNMDDFIEEKEEITSDECNTSEEEGG